MLVEARQFDGFQDATELQERYSEVGLSPKAACSGTPAVSLLVHERDFDFTAERVVFKAPDSAFAVLMGCDLAGRPQTLCGPLSQVAEGERMTVVATASEQPRFGPRWEVESVTLKEPDDSPSRIAFL